MLKLLFNRRVLIAIVVVGGLLTLALWPSAVDVDTGTVTRGPMEVTIDEEGQTRVRERYVVSAPVAGRVVRIELEPGDRVTRGQTVARLLAEAPPLLDARTRAEAQAAADTARAALGRARAEEQRARAALSLAQRDLARIRQLAASKVVSQFELEAREADARTAEESVNAAAYAVRAASSDLQRAQATLNPRPVGTGRVVAVPAPVDGVILKRLRESESVVPPGEPLLEIGDPRQLEIVADLLSTDAVRVTPGARATIEQWGGQKELEARVRRIEPSGFTKISALGVEEQRVNVIMDFTDPAVAWAALGDAYRVEVRIVTWSAPEVLKVPTSALFRQGDEWAVYAADGARARRTAVKVGHQNGQEAEVLSGLTESRRIVLHPGDTVRDGARITVRSAS
jgi:HlyD family secretion protein